METVVAKVTLRYKPKFIGIVGSRTRITAKDKALLRARLIKLAEYWGYERIHIVSGGCVKGADQFAFELAKEIGFPITVFFPRVWQLDTNLVKKNPRAAWAIINYDRNTDIAVLSEVLVATVASDRKGGTENTIKTYKKLGKTKLRLT